LKKVHIILLCVFVFLCIVTVSNAYAHDIKFMLGGSLSRYKIQPEVYFTGTEEIRNEVSYKSGFLMGVGIELALAKNMALEIDALYLQKGSKVQQVTFPLEIYALETNYTFHAISVPALFKIRLTPGTSPYVLGGAEIALAISHRKSTPDAYIPEEDLNGGVDITDTTTRFDYSIVFGTGLELKAKGCKFFIEGRYHYGLSNIAKRPIYWESVKTRTIIFLVGFKI